MIRKTQNSRDWEYIRQICCETALSGNPISKERWPFFGEQWVGPYQKFLRKWTWVAVDSNDHVIGYLTGCPDSSWLERQRKFRFDPILLIKIARRKFPFNQDVRTYLKRLFHVEKSPDRCFPQNLRPTLKLLYPAHLHINLSESARGSGLGKKLIDAYVAELREKQIPGVHVYCGPAPVPFYERMGFQHLHEIEFRPGVKVYCLGLSI